MKQNGYEKVRGLCLRFSLIFPNDHVTVALSGGADSVALAHMLLRLQKEWGFTLTAAHLNHGLRGEESDRDEAFVRAWCKERNLPLTVKAAHLAEQKKPAGKTLEEWARDVRYAFLEKAAQGGKIATAHTLSDQAETVLMHIVRGAGAQGAGGISPKRQNLIRPLLELSRSEIEQYCAENQLDYVTDSTNLDTAYSRNYIRLQVLPMLKVFNPRTEAALGRFAEEQRELAAYMTQQAENLLQKAKQGEGYAAAILCKAPVPVLKTALLKLLSEKGQAGEKLVRLTVSILEKQSGAVETTGGVIWECRGGLLQKRVPKPCTVSIGEQPFSVGSVQKIGDWTVSSLVSTYEETIKFLQMEKNTLNFLTDYDKILNGISIRAAQGKDRFALQGHQITKTIKNLRRENGIPAGDLLPVLTTGEEILWAAPFGFSRMRSLKSGERPDRVLAIKARKED